MFNTLKKFQDLGYTVIFMDNAWFIAPLNTERFQYLGNMTQVKERYKEMLEYKQMKDNRLLQM